MLDCDQKIRSEYVSYQKILDLDKMGLDVDQLPFIKRYPYEDEQEFRIVYTDRNKVAEVKEFKIALSAIKRISLSPWMPQALSKSVVSTLRSIDGCASLKISRSTLVENKKWKSIAKRLQAASLTSASA
jgi:hypothetical protein